jgi:DNA-directed RNA polymerase subunit RPC12/RpoP
MSKYEIECPNCGSGLEWHDYFGLSKGFNIVKKTGYIYKCTDCESVYHIHIGSDELREGVGC